MADRARFLRACGLGFVLLAATQAEAVARPSEQMIRMTYWVIRSGDNRGFPFMVIDKVGAEVFVFDSMGVFMGATPALIGSARGDHSVLGVGDRELSAIRPSHRTTPAGRYLARIGPSVGLGKVLWVDFPSAVALHPVITANPRERRVERLRSPSAKDNRITYGCINISPKFYNDTVRTVFGGTGGVVYILPETRPLSATFPAFRPDL